MLDIKLFLVRVVLVVEVLEILVIDAVGWSSDKDWLVEWGRF